MSDIEENVKAWDAKVASIAKAIAPDIRQATESNAHTEAQIIIAKAYGFRSSLYELEQIKLRKDRNGYITNKDYNLRYSINCHMLRLIKELSTEAHDILHDCL